MRTAQPCGTHSSWQRHINRGEAPCGPCRDARNAYERQRYHTLDPDTRAAKVRYVKSRYRASRRLIDEYPERYAELCREEMARAGAQ